MLSRFLFVLAAFTASALAAGPPAETDFVLGKKVMLKSAVLGEDRSLQIFTPANYETAKSSYPTLPVLYLLDGADHYVHATGLIDYLARKGRIPPMIIVAIGNTQRQRDFTPVFTAAPDPQGKLRKLNERFKDSGGAGKFFEFMRDELIPYVEKTYRTAPFRILDGHSLGGLFAADVLQKNPATFQAYILTSPSLWWDQEALLKRPGPIGLARQFVFVSVGNEGGPHRPAIDHYVAQLKERATPGLAWKFKAYDDESHGSVPHLTLYDALQFIFSGWYLTDNPEEFTALTFASVAKHYAGLSEKYGYTLPVPAATLHSIVQAQTGRNRWDEAIAAAKEGIRLHPQLAGTQVDLGDIYAKKGDRDAALAAYRKALEIDPKHDAAKKALAKLEPEAKAP